MTIGTSWLETSGVYPERGRWTARGSTWTPDDRIIFASPFLSGLSSVSAEGGAPTKLTKPD